ncbi:GIY-YIG catalytic domain-containing endonuclease [Acanthocystis turfacea Chlorella virus Can0610SP]|nr:GIY-YIG catalytic domain-containing endonuclease [Acanthocystis turfacea Chlorella virus Can0610SP]
MGFIYMLTSPSGKSYIGQTIRQIEERFKKHQVPSSNCVAISNAIQKYGWDNFEKHWYEVPDDDLNDHEELMVEVLGTLSPSGYNLKEGGGNGKPSEETRRKIGAANTGKIVSEEAKKKISKTLTGKPKSDKTKQKMSAAKSGENHPMFGQTHTDEAKQKIGGAHKGDKNHNYGQSLSDETKQKISCAQKGENNSTSKKVYQYDIDGTFVQSFASTGEAARSLNKSDGSTISSCARGTKTSAYGFKWSYTKL